jgi:hypothetical protein
VEGNCGGPEHTTVRHSSPSRSAVLNGHGVVAFKGTHSGHSLTPEDELSTYFRNVGYQLPNDKDINLIGAIPLCVCMCMYVYIYVYTHTHTGCPRRNVPDFGRVFLMLKHTDITQNTYVQSWKFTEIIAKEVWNFDSCYTLINYQIHIKTGRNMVSVMLISVLNIKLTCEWHKAITLNYKNTRAHVIVVLRVPSTIHDTWMPSTDVTLSAWRKHVYSLRLAWA